jgi:hypothetical protein
LRDFDPFETESDTQKVYKFPNPPCIFSYRSDLRWLDAVKLRLILDAEVVEYRNTFCNLMIEELHALKLRSFLPQLSGLDLKKILETPRFGLLPEYQDELRMIFSSSLEPETTHCNYDFSHMSDSAQTCIMDQARNCFSLIGHDTTIVSKQLKDSWKSKLTQKVQQSHPNSDREQRFHELMITALEHLQSQSQLYHLNAERWHNYWSTFAFEKCSDLKTQSIIKDIAMDMISSSSMLAGKDFSQVADTSARVSDVDDLWKSMLSGMLSHPRPPHLRLTNIHELSNLDVIKVPSMLFFGLLFF